MLGTLKLLLTAIIFAQAVPIAIETPTTIKAASEARTKYDTAKNTCVRIKDATAAAGQAAPAY